MSAPLVAVGDVIRIAEADYCFGRGELHLRVTHVPAGANLPGLEWINLLGVEIRWDGTDGRHVQALVLVAALRKQRPEQPAG